MQLDCNSIIQNSNATVDETMASRHYMSFASTYFHGYFMIKIFLAHQKIVLYLTGGLLVISPNWKEPKWKCSTFCGLSGTNTYP